MLFAGWFEAGWAPRVEALIITRATTRRHVGRKKRDLNLDIGSSPLILKVISITDYGSYSQAERRFRSATRLPTI
jgi:hypothetical protein